MWHQVMRTALQNKELIEVVLKTEKEKHNHSAVFNLIDYAFLFIPAVITIKRVSAKAEIYCKTVSIRYCGRETDTVVPSPFMLLISIVP